VSLNNKDELIENIIALDEDFNAQLPNFGQVVIGPLHKHEGSALAQLLRQYLAHAVKGSAISALKIEGVSHVFDLVTGVKEDVHQIINNLKKVVLKTSTDITHISIKKNKAGVIKAGDFVGANMNVCNPHQMICTLSEDVEFHLECLVTTGVSYMSEEENQKRISSDWIAFGADYTPVKNVSYEIKELSVGDYGSLEELVLNIKTNGSVTPLHAVHDAAKRLQSVISLFLQEQKNEMNKSESEDQKNNKLPFDQILLNPISILDLSPRAQHCIRYYNLTYIGELVMMSSEQLLAVPNVGANSVNEIKDKLAAQ